MENSLIGWTHHTWNAWEGCTKVSPACLKCYAEARSIRFDHGNWGPGAPRRRTSSSNWLKPLLWNKRAGNFVRCDLCGRAEIRGFDGIGLKCCSTPGCLALPETECTSIRQRVFCSSLSDWLDHEVPTQWLAEALTVIRKTTRLQWLMLSKRPEQFRPRIAAAIKWLRSETKGTDAWIENIATAEWLSNWLEGKYPPHVWIGCTMESQDWVEKRAGVFLAIPARLHFVSVEPQLGPMKLSKYLRKGPDGCKGIGWVISGGESLDAKGKGCRHMEPAWPIALRDQCIAAGVPFFFKQWGNWLPVPIRNDDSFSGGRVYDDPRGGSHALVIRAKSTAPFMPGKLWHMGPGDETVGHVRMINDSTVLIECGKKMAGNLLDGKLWEQVPDTDPVTGLAYGKL